MASRPSSNPRLVGHYPLTSQQYLSYLARANPCEQQNTKNLDLWKRKKEGHDRQR